MFRESYALSRDIKKDRLQTATAATEEPDIIRHNKQHRLFIDQQAQPTLPLVFCRPPRPLFGCQSIF
jgi:hypothetical protein